MSVDWSRRSSRAFRSFACKHGQYTVVNTQDNVSNLDIPPIRLRGRDLLRKIALLLRMRFLLRCKLLAQRVVLAARGDERRVEARPLRGYGITGPVEAVARLVLRVELVQQRLVAADGLLQCGLGMHACLALVRERGRELGGVRTERVVLLREDRELVLQAPLAEAHTAHKARKRTHLRRRLVRLERRHGAHEGGALGLALAQLARVRVELVDRALLERAARGLEALVRGGEGAVLCAQLRRLGVRVRECLGRRVHRQALPEQPLVAVLGEWLSVGI